MRFPVIMCLRGRQMPGSEPVLEAEIKVGVERHMRRAVVISVVVHLPTFRVAEDVTSNKAVYLDRGVFCEPETQAGFK